MRRYVAVEFVPGRWHIELRGDGYPPAVLHDNAMDGQDAPVIFRDEDAVMNAVRELNEELDQQE